MANQEQRTIALIGGTGMAQGLEKVLQDPVRHENVEVRFGEEKGEVLFYLEGRRGDLRVLVLPRHGPTLAIPDRSPAKLVQEKGYEAHVWFFHEQGVEAVYAFNAVGALDLDVPLASDLAFVVPDDYGRGLAATVHSFGKLAKNVHPGMKDPFCPRLRRLAVRAIEKAGARAIPRGLYIYDGPDPFETDAEVRAVARLYAGEPNRVLGMTAGPELMLCKQLEIPYALICSNTNYAQGYIEADPVTHELVHQRMKPAADTLIDIAARVVELAAAEGEPGSNDGAMAKGGSE